MTKLRRKVSPKMITSLVLFRYETARMHPSGISYVKPAGGIVKVVYYSWKVKSDIFAVISEQIEFE